MNLSRVPKTLKLMTISSELDCTGKVGGYWGLKGTGGGGGGAPK